MKSLLREYSLGRSKVSLITFSTIQFPQKTLISMLDVGTWDCKVTKAYAGFVWKPMSRYKLPSTMLSKKKEVAPQMISEGRSMLSLQWL